VHASGVDGEPAGRHDADGLADLVDGHIGRNRVTMLRIDRAVDSPGDRHAGRDRPDVGGSKTIATSIAVPMNTIADAVDGDGQLYCHGESLWSGGYREWWPIERTGSRVH